MRPRSRALLVLAVLVAGAGCAALPGDSQPNPADVRQNAVSKVDALDAYAATVHVRLNGSLNQTVTYRVAYQDGRTNVTYRSPERVAGTRLVSNGTATVQYDPRTNRATVTYGTTPTHPLASLAGMLDGNATYEGETEARDGFAVEYAVEGGDASLQVGAGGGPYQFVSKGADVNRTTRVWVDRDRGIPVKARTVSAFENTTQRLTVELTNVTLSPTFADDRFDPNVPASATVTTNRVVTSDDIAAIRANASVSVPTPDVPAPYEFEDGMVVSYGNQTTVTLTYATPNDTTLLVTKRVPASERAGSGERIDVSGTTVRYVEDGDRTQVRWTADGATYTVTGDGRDLLVAVAESLVAGEASAGTGATASGTTRPGTVSVATCFSD
ncbi:outer membrane lipoprotein-sorting protein [Salarchaeum japonicum]|uniref:outer membrane lipoprotein-sorting protein n=1 Tax=Salarchaeum japonicum TaxID=555573 RepID=UPI001D09FB5E|nr:hypothetical protein [Salarchaeum japonicum]